jgi:type IV pilus assembly protein PilE
MQTTKMKKLNSKGFTLIELLIVIIIIGILAAIAFVAYSGSQTKAKQADMSSTIEEERNKLGEYNADNGNYPKDIGTFTTWLQDTSSTGGDSPSLATTLGQTGYSYTANPSGCDNSATQCTGYQVKADHTALGGSSDVTETN